jgi:hypothetical protein
MSDNVQSVNFDIIVRMAVTGRSTPIDPFSTLPGVNVKKVHELPARTKNYKKKKRYRMYQRFTSFVRHQPKETEHKTDGSPCWCNPKRVSYRKEEKR